MFHRKDLALEHAVEGKVIYLLALIVLVQFGYPITAYGTLALIAYELLYASMIVVGILLGRDSRFHTVFLSITGTIYLLASLAYAINPNAAWAVFITYLALIPYLGMLLWILGRFLVIVKTINRDVLYAAVALYLLIGGIFVPLYGLLDFLAPGSFRDATFADVAVQWQQLVYYSYTTLTSTGYGEILPTSLWARSLANLEMVAGGLYITIVMSRLVSLYSENIRRTKMKIAIIGAGNIGGILGKKWAEAGHTVIFGVRNPTDAKHAALASLGSITSIADALTTAEVILLSLPGAAVTDFAAQHGTHLAGKVVIDATNKPGAPVMHNLAALKQHAPHAQIVRAFSTLGGENFANPSIDGVQIDLFYCGDAAARSTADQLIAEIGLRPVYVGDLNAVDVVDGMTRLWFTLAFAQGKGRRIAFKLLGA